MGYRITVIATKEIPTLPITVNGICYQIIRLFFKRPFKKGYSEKINNIVAEISKLDFSILHCHIII